MLTREQIEQAPTPFDPNPEYAENKRAWEAFRRGEGPQPRQWRYIYGGNRAMASAWRKGALAALEGRRLSACPYDDERTDRGGITFSRAFIRAWGEGWHYATFDGEENVCKLMPVHGGKCQVKR